MIDILIHCGVCWWCNHFFSCYKLWWLRMKHGDGSHFDVYLSSWSILFRFLSWSKDSFVLVDIDHIIIRCLSRRRCCLLQSLKISYCFLEWVLEISTLCHSLIVSSVLPTKRTSRHNINHWLIFFVIHFLECQLGDRFIFSLMFLWYNFIVSIR